MGYRLFIYTLIALLALPACSPAATPADELKALIIEKTENAEAKKAFQAVDADRLKARTSIMCEVAFALIGTEWYQSEDEIIVDIAKEFPMDTEVSESAARGWLNGTKEFGCENL